MRKTLFVSAFIVVVLNLCLLSVSSDKANNTSMLDLITTCSAQGEASSGLWPCENSSIDVHTIRYDNNLLAYEHYVLGPCVGSYGMCETGSRFFAYSYYDDGSTSAEMTDCTTTSYC